jgi:II/X family phage/plasmid replication protein
VQPGGIATALEIDVCPPKLLQRHNIFGHSDLIDYVNRIFDVLTKKHQIDVSAKDLQMWRLGQFKLTEVHLTANFGCPRQDVLLIIDAIDQDQRFGKHRDFVTGISLGFSEKRRSKRKSLSIYDKYEELISAWKTTGRIRKRLLNEVANNALRVELKLFSQGLKYLGLDIGAAWQKVDVSALYFENLKHFKIKRAIQRLLTTDEESALSLKQRNVYRAWIQGTSVQEQFSSRTSAAKYIKEIQGLTGVDISGNRRPQALPKIELQALLTPENVTSVPDWLLDSEYYVSPRKQA